MSDRIRFKIRANNGRFECDAVAEWRELDAAASACGLTRQQLEMQLRVCAIFAQRARELDPSTKPTAWVACGEVKDVAPVIEGRLVA